MSLHMEGAEGVASVCVRGEGNFLVVVNVFHVGEDYR